MGDILHALPAVTALRQAYPGWVIDWVVEPRWRALLSAEDPAEAAEMVREGYASGAEALADVALLNVRAESPDLPALAYQTNPARPIVNRIHLAATRDWRKSPLSRSALHEIRALRRDLKNGGYDAVLDLQGAIRSAMLGRMAGCRRLIGEAVPRERAARWLFTEQIETHGAHVIEQDVELASAVAGDDLKPVTPWLPVDSAAEAWADGILPRGESRPAVLVNPGAGWGAKRWPVERYSAVAQGLIDRGLRVLINAGPGEEALAETIVRSAAAATVVHCSLEQLIALTRRVSLAVAGDTGPLHLACALRRPVVGIYGPTDPSRNGPFGTRFRVLRSPESRRDHTRHAEPEAGLITILAKNVLRAADELLAEENSG
jgi:heptosyltransferase-1